MNKHRRSVMYPSIAKCNGKRCSCCKHVCCKSTIKSNVNGRHFSIVTNSDLNWRSTDDIYDLSWEEKGCGVQCVGQTSKFLKKKIDLLSTIGVWKSLSKLTIFFIDFLNSLIILLVTFLVEKILYADNSTKRYSNTPRHELEWKWIKLLQTPHSLGFNDNIYHADNISRLPEFSLLDIRKRNKWSHGKCKNRNLKRWNRHSLTLTD